jgi:predicted MFS family arabinose efflux permease
MSDARIYKWQLVAMLWMVVLLNYADRQALSGTLPLIRNELHLSPHEQGLLGAAFAWIYGLCSPFAGRLVDRVRRSTAVLGGLQVWSVICAATAFAPGFRSLLALRAAEGLGETAYFPASVSLISDHHDATTRSRALALHQTGVYAGIVGGTTAAALIGERFGWRASFATFGIAGILLGFVLRRTLREPEQRAVATTPPPLADVMKHIATPVTICLILAFICANGVASVLFVWLPTFVNTQFHRSLALSGFAATATAQAGSFAGALTGGYFADRARMRWSSGRVIVQAIGLVLGIPFVIFSATAGSLTAAAIGFVGWGFAKGLYEANIFASVFDVTPHDMRGTLVGVMNMAGWLFGAGTAPVIVGYIAEHASLSAAIASTALLYAVGAALLIATAMMMRSERYA